MLTGTTPTEIHVSARVERSPVVTLQGEPSPATQEVCAPHEVTVAVAAGDESGVVSVVANLTGPVGVARVELVQDGPWFLHVVPPSVVGDWTVDIIAADVRGNLASVTTGFAVVPCSNGHNQSPLA